MATKALGFCSLIVIIVRFILLNHNAPMKIGLVLQPRTACLSTPNQPLYDMVAVPKHGDCRMHLAGVDLRKHQIHV